MAFFHNFFKKSKPTTDFADFFRNAPAAEKKKLFKRVIRKASEDQRAIIKKYDQLNSKTAA